MTVFRFRLYLLFTLVVTSESFQNGRRNSILFHGRSLLAPSRVPCSRFSWAAFEQRQGTAVGAVCPTTTRGDGDFVATKSFQDDPENAHVRATARSDYSANKFHLLSLQWTTPDDITAGDNPARRFSKIVTNVWRWKDAALGDGRDYFVPRPKTLRALQSYLLSQIAAAAATTATSSSCSLLFHIKDCVILSNCARFEILLELERHCTMSNEKENEGDMIKLLLAEIVSSALLCQVESFQKPRHSFSALQQLLLPAVDWPGVIDMNASRANTGTTLTSSSSSSSAAATAAAAAAKELSQHWTHFTSLECIMQHLSHVAAGLASRPRRPDRAVIFRPFSSRDAHILLQLKRTVDLFGRGRVRRDASSSTTTKNSSLESSSSSSPSASNLPQLLRFALQAGKAARNPAVVPELEQLREYGTGDDSRYTSEVPAEVQNRVVEAVLAKAIVPTIHKCIFDFKAQQSAALIQKLRMNVEQMAETTQELTFVRRHLHEPTVRMRRGERVDTNALVQELSMALKASRGPVVATTSD